MNLSNWIISKKFPRNDWIKNFTTHRLGLGVGSTFGIPGAIELSTIGGMIG